MPYHRSAVMVLVVRDKVRKYQAGSTIISDEAHSYLGTALPSAYPHMHHILHHVVAFLCRIALSAPDAGNLLQQCTLSSPAGVQQQSAAGYCSSSGPLQNAVTKPRCGGHGVMSHEPSLWPPTVFSIGRMHCLLIPALCQCAFLLHPAALL